MMLPETMSDARIQCRRTRCKMNRPANFPLRFGRTEDEPAHGAIDSVADVPAFSYAGATKRMQPDLEKAAAAPRGRVRRYLPWLGMLFLIWLLSRYDLRAAAEAF